MVSTSEYPVIERIELEPRWVTRQVKLDTVKAHALAEKKAAPGTTMRSSQDIERWLESLEFELAPEGHVICRKKLREVFDAAALVGDIVNDDTFTSAIGMFLRRRFGERLIKVKTLYNVTCKAVKSELFKRPRTDKKAVRLKKHGARNPAASRTVEADDGVSVRYVTEFMQLGCATELLQNNLFPDAKELSESFGAFNAWRNHLSTTFRADDDDVTLISVGDGQTPRTAALFAYRTKWQCIAVDPEMNEKGQTYDIQRLQHFRAKIEELRIKTKRALIVMVHAHVSLEATLASITTSDGTCGCIALPCCNWYAAIDTDHHPKVTPEYQDMSIFSPHRSARIWANLPCGMICKPAM